jgi:TatA/E family protein of Tat protein translocase
VSINGGELLIILLVALVVLGPKELPRIGRTLGTMVREFRRASQGLMDELGLDDGAGKRSRPHDRGRDLSEGSAEK